MVAKLKALVKSRRFWAAVGGVMTLILHEVLGLDEDTSSGIVVIITGWIIGDSLDKTE